MLAISRRYDGIDQNRVDELTQKVTNNLIPQLSKLPGFGGYFVTEADDGAIMSTSLFDTPVHADASTRVAAEWIKDENLTSVLPNPPKVTVHKVMAYETGTPALV